jgi:hypothetical protein
LFVKEGTEQEEETYLEVLNIDWIESNSSSIQPHICLGDVLAEIVRTLALAEMFLYSIEGCEKLCNSLLIRVCFCSETRSIDTVVDIVVRPIVRSFDFALQVLGEEIDLFIFRRDYIVELKFISQVPTPKGLRTQTSV